MDIKYKDKLKTITKNVGDITSNVNKKALDLSSKTKQTLENSQDLVVKALDENKDGKVDIEDIIILGLRLPGVKINREEFLRKELFKKFPNDVIEDAIKFNPKHANIPIEEINFLADEVIKYERNCVSGISAALSMPGGISMVATLPADIVQYYGYMLRATQKLMYLYGFPEIDVTENKHGFDSETINILILSLGVMYGAAGANNALKSIAKALATGVEKKQMKKALTKGTIYPIVKSVSSWFGKKMTKDVFAGFFKKSIPVIDGIVGGGITFFSFKPCCDNLKKSLQNTMLSNPDYIPSTEDKDIDEIGIGE